MKAFILLGEDADIGGEYPRRGIFKDTDGKIYFVCYKYWYDSPPSGETVLYGSGPRMIWSDHKNTWSGWW